MSSNKVKGKVVVEGGEHYLEIPSLKGKQKKQLLPLGPQIDKKTIASLVGTEVEVLLSEPQQFVVGFIWGHRPILCYYPVIDVISPTIDTAVKESLVKQFVDEGII
ncbi:MAG: hypothetical protein WAK45_07305, partial [Methanoregula sp.]|uniref:hypothetical protein n=1 Tax=Methanoregula sp. TaxID=2052170 RepID=UPI003BAE45C3